IDIEELECIHRRKTGALLRACVLLAADYRADLPADKRQALADFGAHVGLAFQIRDDILDIESTTEQLGKTQGKDVAHDKATYPALIGMDNAKVQAEQLYEAAIEALVPFGDRAQPLHDLAR